MNAFAAYGLLAHGLIFGALATLLPLGVLRPRIGLGATAVALLGGIAPVMHASFGAPSVTLLCLALFQLAGVSRLPLNAAAGSGILAFALIFYPLAMGWSSFDPYALGYQPWVLISGLLPLGLALWLRRQSAWLLILAIDLSVYASGLFDNFWDVLIDPLLVAAAAFVALRGPVARFIASRRR